MRKLTAAVVAASFAATAQGATLVGPSDDWFGVDDLEITYSGGTALFDVRFDRRSFNDVFGSGTPAFPFTSESDKLAALGALGDFFDSQALQPLDFGPVIPTSGGSADLDHFFLPLTFDATDVMGVVETDFGGPAGWVEEVVASVNVGRADEVWTRVSDGTWVVFTPVPAPATLVVFGAFGLGATRRR